MSLSHTKLLKLCIYVTSSLLQEYKMHNTLLGYVIHILPLFLEQRKEKYLNGKKLLNY